MRRRKQNTGMGDYQIDKAQKAKWAILEALADGNWHRNKDLKEKTKLSSRTLAKHLERMVKIPVIERKEDNESGKYPIPVLYRIISPLDTYVRSNILRTLFADQIETILDETKDPLFILDTIHALSQEGFVELLRRIQQSENISNEELYFFGECFLWANYKIFIARLMGASRKLKNELNIHQLLTKQAERQIWIYTKLLQSYKKMENKNQQT